MTLLVALTTSIKKIPSLLDILKGMANTLWKKMSHQKVFMDGSYKHSMVANNMDAVRRKTVKRRDRLFSRKQLVEALDDSCF